MLYYIESFRVCDPNILSDHCIVDFSFNFVKDMVDPNVKDMVDSNNITETCNVELLDYIHLYVWDCGKKCICLGLW